MDVLRCPADFAPANENKGKRQRYRPEPPRKRHIGRRLIPSGAAGQAMSISSQSSRPRIKRPAVQSSVTTAPCTETTQRCGSNCSVML